MDLISLEFSTTVHNRFRVEIYFGRVPLLSGVLEVNILHVRARKNMHENF